MIKNKKLMMALSFTLGATLLVSTAFADIVSMSGYEQLKQAIKYTSTSWSKNLKSYTCQYSVTIKDNEKVLYNTTDTAKYDNTIGSTSQVSYNEYCNGSKETHNSYSDKKCSIWYNSWNDTYQIFEYAKDKDEPQYSDIFAEDDVKDIEKIIDAGVGNLKDYVIVSENSDGSKEFSGALNDAQIPALINAISSFALKRTIPDISLEIGDSFPQIKDDLFIKNVTGKATVNKDGILERLLGTGIISGKDEKGKAHDLTIEVLVRCYDINSTVVTKPDLTGKKVEKQFENKSTDQTVSQKYIGKYRQDIVIEKDNSFVKIGERTVVISYIDVKYVSGKYSESYNSEYTEYAKDKQEFNFKAEIQSNEEAHFEITNAQGIKESGYINFYSTTGILNFDISLQLNNESRPLFDNSTFNRVFED